MLTTFRQLRETELGVQSTGFDDVSMKIPVVTLVAAD